MISKLDSLKGNLIILKGIRFQRLYLLKNI